MGEPVRHTVGLLAALILLAACDADAGNSGPTPASPASTASAPATTTTVAAPSTAQGPRTEKWIDLQVGDCLADPPPSDPSVVTVSVVDCADRKSTRLNSSHGYISYAVFCLKKKK